MQQAVLPLCLLGLFALASKASASDWRACPDSEGALIHVHGVGVEPEPAKAGSAIQFYLDTQIGEAVSGGALEVSVRYLGVSVYSKSGSLCEAVPCPLAEGPARLTLAQQMPSAAPPGSYTITLHATGTAGQLLFCVEVDFHVHWLDSTRSALAGWLRAPQARKL